MITLNKINLVFLGILFCSSSACAGVEAESVEVNGEIIILNINTCKYKINGGRYEKLGLLKKCHFIKQSNTNKIATEYIDDIKSYVLIIVGDSVTNYPDFPLTKTRNDCGTQLQAIVLPKNGMPQLSKIIKETITCAGIGVDKKEFWIITH